MGDDPAAELRRADEMMREADDMERRVAALRRSARQLRAKHANWRDPALTEALRKALDGEKP